MATGQGGAEILTDKVPTLTCNHEAPIAAYSVALRGGGTPHVLAPVCIQNATRGKDQNGLGVSEPGAPMYTLDQGSQHGVAYAFKSGQSEAAGGIFVTEEFAPTLQAANNGSTAVPAVAYAFDSRQDPVSSQHVFGAPGTSSPQAQAVAHVSTMPTLRAGTPNGGTGHGARSGDSKDEYIVPVCITGDITHTLRAEGFDASEDGTGRGQPITAEWEVVAGWAVRRLMPIECERLQAFPDNYTLIPVKKAKKRSKMFDYAMIDGELWQLAADGPRYKALGNSMCVHNMRWIGQRIHQHLANPFGDLL